MTDFAKNGFPLEARASETDPHEELRELCALSIAGELTVSERQRLDKHLRGCAACRKLLGEYEEIGSSVIPQLAAEFHSDMSREDGDSWSIEHAGERLMDSLTHEPNPLLREAPKPARKFIGEKVLKLGLVASVLAALSLASFQFGRIAHRPTRQTDAAANRAVAPSSSSSSGQALSNLAQSGRVVASGAEEKRISDLKETVARQRQENLDLKDQLNQLDADFAQQKTQLNQSLEEKAELVSQLALAQANSRNLEARLNETGSQGIQESGELSALKSKMGELNAALDAKDTEIARNEALLAHDRDIRNLIGARNLYIAEIYDVNKSGDTQKPFGRVFYTKDRSLIFYGYDLDQQHGAKKDASFQAWGRRGTDEHHDVNLGLLYLDDADKRRWVLKFNDPKTVAELDAVFITVEPQGGSSKPTGKPLLFTYLRLDPNHP